VPSQISWVLEGLSDRRLEDIQESRSAARDAIVMSDNGRCFPTASHFL